MVTWNVRALALAALRSLHADLDASGLSADVYVVDNASSDGTAEAVAAQFPQVRLTACADNLGFVRANNLAMQQMGFGGGQPETLPRAVYLLNPDTMTPPGATRALYDALVHEPSLGLVGARLEYGDGSFQHSAFGFPGLRQLWAEFFPTPGRFLEGAFNGRYPRALYEAGEPFRVDFVLGATMMLKREVIRQIGLLDETFFMYCEEIDWAWRIRKAGWQVACVPGARIVHLGGQSAGQAKPQSVVRLWTSRLRLYEKHYPAWKRVLARWMIAAGMRVKMRAARALPPGEREPLLAAYRQVYRLALGR